MISASSPTRPPSEATEVSLLVAVPLLIAEAEVAWSSEVVSSFLPRVRQTLVEPANSGRHAHRQTDRQTVWEPGATRGLLTESSLRRLADIIQNTNAHRRDGAFVRTAKARCTAKAKTPPSALRLSDCGERLNGKFCERPPFLDCHERMPARQLRWLQL